jgi:hypothetical protein
MRSPNLRYFPFFPKPLDVTVVTLPRGTPFRNRKQVSNRGRLGVPVIVLAKDGSILHGEQTLRWIKETGAPIKAVRIQGIDRQGFEGCELPEICEAAREAWLADTFPK